MVPYPKRIKDEINLFWHKPKRIFYLDIAKLHLHRKLRPSFPIFLSTFLLSHKLSIIKPAFSKKGINNSSVVSPQTNLFWHKPKRIFYLDIAKLHLHPKLFNKPDPKRFLKNKERLERVENFLEDEESKIVMQNMLNYWISGDLHLLYVLDKEPI